MQLSSKTERGQRAYPLRVEQSDDNCESSNESERSAQAGLNSNQASHAETEFGQ